MTSWAASRFILLVYLQMQKLRAMRPQVTTFDDAGVLGRACDNSPSSPLHNRRLIFIRHFETDQERGEEAEMGPARGPIEPVKTLYNENGDKLNNGNRVIHLTSTAKEKAIVTGTGLAKYTASIGEPGGDTHNRTQTRVAEAYVYDKIPDKRFQVEYEAQMVETARWLSTGFEDELEQEGVATRVMREAMRQCADSSPISRDDLIKLVRSIIHGKHTFAAEGDVVIVHALNLIFKDICNMVFDDEAGSDQLEDFRKELERVYPETAPALHFEGAGTGVRKAQKGPRSWGAWTYEGHALVLQCFDGQWRMSTPNLLKLGKHGQLDSTHTIWTAVG